MVKVCNSSVFFNVFSVWLRSRFLQKKPEVVCLWNGVFLQPWRGPSRDPSGEGGLHSFSDGHFLAPWSELVDRFFPKTKGWNQRKSPGRWKGNNHRIQAIHFCVPTCSFLGCVFLFTPKLEVIWRGGKWMNIVGTCPKDLLPKDKCQVSLPVVKGFV